ncbi:MAG: hypothetical protein LBT24_06865, partial [Tannerella sp.]|nr:hypothetical protein [Tannerella sp.]
PDRSGTGVSFGMFYVETAASVKKQTAPMDIKPAKEILGICRLLIFQGARRFFDVRKLRF